MTGRTRTIAAALIVASVAFAAFASTLGHGFVTWDDDVYVYANPAIQPFGARQVAWLFTHFYYYAYIPVTMHSHALDVAVWGMNPHGHHLTNVLLHAGNAVWILLVGLALHRNGRDISSGGPRSPRSFGPPALVAMSIASLLFAIHPLRVESVSWISDRKDLLCTFFFLPGVLAYTRYASLRGSKGSGRWYAATFVLYLLAVLSKSIAVALPIILLALDWLLLARGARNGGVGRLLLEKVPFLVVSGILSIISFAMSPDGKRAYAVTNLSGVEEALFPFHSLSFSLLKTLLPVNLAPIYPEVGLESMVAGLGIVILISATCVVYAIRGTRGALLAWIAYLVLLVPNVVGLKSGMQPVADRYSYLATIGLCLALGAGIAGILERWWIKRIVPVASGFGVVAAALFALTVSQASHWRSSTSLWEFVVSSSPATRDYSDAYLNLGAAYAGEGRAREALGILERAIRIDPTNAEAHFNSGIISYATGAPEPALEFFRKATVADPSHARAFFNLAIVSGQLGRDEEAMGAMIQAAQLGSKDAQEALTSRGVSW